MSVWIPRPFRELGLAFLVGLVGCASTPPTEAISNAEIKIRKANSMGAAVHAPLELQVAIKMLELAKQSLKNGENEVARRLAEEAQVQGELTEAMTLAPLAEADASPNTEAEGQALPEPVPQPTLAEADTSPNTEAEGQALPEPVPQPALPEADTSPNIEAEPHTLPNTVPQPTLAEADASPNTEAAPQALPEPVPQPALAEEDATQNTEASTEVPLDAEPVSQPTLAEADTSPNIEAEGQVLPNTVLQPTLAEADTSPNIEAEGQVLPNTVPQPTLAEADASPNTEAAPQALPEPVHQPALAEEDATQNTEASTEVPLDAEPVSQPTLAEANTTQNTGAGSKVLPEIAPQPNLAELDASQITEPQTPVLSVADEKLAALEAQKREVAALKALKAKQTKRGAVVTLGDVLFESAGRDLSIEAIRTLMDVATFLHEYPERTVAIEGHTDNIGPEGFNVTVSQRRAKSVQNILLDGGVEQARISAEGYGEAHPVASNASRAGRKRNRRVELVIQSPNSPAKGSP